MEADIFKGNKPELPVDYNGNAIQVWTAGGRTIHVSSEDFIAESSLIRICSGESVVKIKLKNKYPEDKDSGMPIPPNTALCFGCWPGDIFSVEGEADITFVRDRGYVKKEEPTITPSVLSWTPDKTGGVDCKCEIKGNVAEFSGKIDYYYPDSSAGRLIGANRVGIQIKPSINVDDYPNLIISINEPKGQRRFNSSVLDKDPEDGSKKLFWYYPSIEKVPYEGSVIFDWTGKGTDIEIFYIKVLADTVLRNG